MDNELLIFVQKIEKDLRNSGLGRANKFGLRKVLQSLKEETKTNKDAYLLVVKLLEEFTEENIVKSCDKDNTRFM